MLLVTTADAEEQRFVDALSRAEPQVRRVLGRLGAFPSDVDDLTQEVFARAWAYRSSFERGKPVAPWLSAIAVRVFTDQRVARARDPASLGSQDVAAPDRPARIAESRDRLAHALAKLTAVQRHVLLAFHRDGASLAEIADRTGMPVNTVKSHLHRARHALSEEDAP